MVSGTYPEHYYRPSHLGVDEEGKLTEIEARATSWDSLTVARSETKEKQTSNKKNVRRATKMIDKKPREAGHPSGRWSVVYTQREIDRWQKVRDRDGNIRHLSTHTNTQTGRVRVFERDEYGDILRTLDDFKMENFEEIKQEIEEHFDK